MSSSSPFWDPGALVPAGQLGNNQIAPGVFSAGNIAPGIWSAIPESPSDPWPDQLSLWETIKLNGLRAPGICRVEGGRRRRIDERFANGSSGVTPANMGYDCGRFTITLTLWTPKQLEQLRAMLDLIQPPPTAKVQPRAVRAEHPALLLWKIDTIYIEGVEFPRHIGKQIFEVVIDAVEYLLPQNEGAAKEQPSAPSTDLGGGTWSVPQPRPMPADPSATAVAP